MAKQSQRWKDLERTAARKLVGRRVIREDFFEVAPDVLCPDFGLVVDCKAHRRFAHHSRLDEVREKYCKPGEIPALVTKAEGQRGEYITLPLDFVAGILNRLRDAGPLPEQQTMNNHGARP